MTRIFETLAAVGLLTFASLASAEEAKDTLSEGFVITKENVDAVKGKTFQGHTIESIVPERLMWQVRNWNLKLKLSTAVPGYFHPELDAATKTYSKEVKLDPTTFELSGYKAGLPFPNIDPEDSLAGVKVIWNAYLSMPQRTTNHFSSPLFAFVFVDADIGIERVQHWAYKRIFYVNRVRGGGAPVIGDGDIMFKTIIGASFPQDIKGLGTYEIRYTSPKLVDIWAYIRTVRRIRRLSGGAWFDAIGGTDLLQDELGVWNAHPSWFQSYKLVGKKPLLAIVIAPWPSWNTKGTDYVSQFVAQNVSEWPHWNPTIPWSARDVYVIETTPPPAHPYSKKIVYIDAQYFVPFFLEAYDKKGDFWKWDTHLVGTAHDAQDPNIKLPVQPAGYIADFQRRHATWYHTESWIFNSPDFDSEEVSLSALEAGGR